MRPKQSPGIGSAHSSRDLIAADERSRRRGKALAEIQMHIDRLARATGIPKHEVSKAMMSIDGILGDFLGDGRYPPRH